VITSVFFKENLMGDLYGTYFFIFKSKKYLDKQIFFYALSFDPASG
jgi:hypothetical protein